MDHWMHGLENLEWWVRDILYSMGETLPTSHDKLPLQQKYFYMYVSVYVVKTID